MKNEATANIVFVLYFSEEWLLNRLPSLVNILYKVVEKRLYLFADERSERENKTKFP